MAYIENLYILARRAKAEGNTENAAKYYSQIAEMAPNDPEAYFYSVYYQVNNCKIGEIGVAANRLKSAYNSTVQLLRNNGSILYRNAAKLIPYANDTYDLAKTLCVVADNHRKNGGDWTETNIWMSNCGDVIISLGDSFYSLGNKKKAVEYYKLADLSLFTYCRKGITNTVLERIEELEPDFQSSFEIYEQEQAEKKKHQEATDHKNTIVTRILIIILIIGIVILCII